MRTLRFEKEQREIFDMLYVSLYQTDENLNREEMKCAGKVQDVFDAKVEDSFDENGVKRRSFPGDSVEFKLEEAQWNVLKKCFYGVKWRTAFAKQYNMVDQYFESVKEEKL